MMTSKEINLMINKGLIKSIKYDRLLFEDCLVNGTDLGDNLYDLNGNTYYINSNLKHYYTLEYLKNKYNAFKKSPFSESYYSNENKKWNGDIDGGVRISTHWNFMSEGEMHCQTINDVVYGKISVGIYDAKIKKYKIVESY